MTAHADKLAEALEKVLPLAKFHSSGSKLDLAAARRVLADFRKLEERETFDDLVERVRALRGRIQVFETQAGLWTAGIYLNDGRKYEWGAGPTVADALSRAVDIAEKAATPSDDCMGLA